MRDNAQVNGHEVPTVELNYYLVTDLTPSGIKGPKGKIRPFSWPKLKERAILRASQGYRVLFENADGDTWAFWYSTSRTQWAVRTKGRVYPSFFASTQQAVDTFIDSWRYDQ